MGLPRKPNVPCKHPGCAELIPAGQKYCEIHKPLHPEEIRSASARGYGKAWQRESKRFLQVHPLCVQCAKEGRYVKATVVDHIKPHRGDETLFWDRSNWQPLCKRCHDRKTRREDETSPTPGTCSCRRSTSRTRSARSERETTASCRSTMWQTITSRSSTRKPSIMCRLR